MKMKFLACAIVAVALAGCSRNSPTYENGSAPGSEQGGARSSANTINAKNEANPGAGSPNVTAGGGNAKGAAAQESATDTRSSEGATNISKNGVPPAGTGSSSPTVNSNKVGHSQQPQ